MASRPPDARSRRSVLASVVSAASAALGVVLLGHGAAAATDGDSIAIGQENVGSGPTRISMDGSGAVFVADASGPGVGLIGRSPTGIGAYGQSGTGHGVLGTSESGSGVEAWSATGVGLRVRFGRIKVDQASGSGTIRAGESGIEVRLDVRPTARSFALLSPMADLGRRRLWSTLRLEDQTLVIQVSSPVDEDVRVGWLLLD
jgi:hypothetical protein